MSVRRLLILIPALAILVAPSGCKLLRLKPAGSTASGTENTSFPSKLREKPLPRKDATNVASQTQGSSPSVTTVQPQPIQQPAAVPKNQPDSSKAPYRMRPNDPIVIILRDLPGTASEQQMQDIIDDAGTVNLPYIGRMVAAGKTSSEFEQEIEKKYIDDKIYLRLTVNVVTPQQFIFVGGEVRGPNKYQLLPGMTLLQAITSAGGFTEYADRTEVQLIRKGKVAKHNARELEKQPEKDVTLEPGDQIIVKRGII